MYLKFGIMDTIGQRFFIECKNENKTPRGDYMSKLHSIISLTNAGGKGQCIKFGIIISKEKGPSTFKMCIRDRYGIYDGSLRAGL